MKPAIVLTLCFSSPWVWGEACDVVPQAPSGEIAQVQTHICYEYQGMPPGSINWSCSNEGQGVSPSTKTRIEHCPAGAKASCESPLGQESLTSERSASRDLDQKSPNIPDGAKLVIWYYESHQQAQAREDCERNDGVFRILP